MGSPAWLCCSAGMPCHQAEEASLLGNVTQGPWRLLCLEEAGIQYVGATVPLAGEVGMEVGKPVFELDLRGGGRV